MDYARTMKQRVIMLHRDDPSLDTADIASMLGAKKRWIREINRRCGLAIPHARLGRPVGTVGSRWYYNSKRRRAT